MPPGVALYTSFAHLRKDALHPYTCCVLGWGHHQLRVPTGRWEGLARHHRSVNGVCPDRLKACFTLVFECPQRRMMYSSPLPVV